MDFERKLVGELTPEEVKINNDLRRQGSEAVRQVGELVLRVLRIGLGVFETEAKNQTMYQDIATRFGIEQGQQWQVLPDGRVYILTPPGTEADKPLDAEKPVEPEEGS